MTFLRFVRRVHRRMFPFFFIHSSHTSRRKYGLGRGETPKHSRSCRLRVAEARPRGWIRGRRCRCSNNDVLISAVVGLMHKTGKEKGKKKKKKNNFSSWFLLRSVLLQLLAACCVILRFESQYAGNAYRRDSAACTWQRREVGQKSIHYH